MDVVYSCAFTIVVQSVNLVVISNHPSVRHKFLWPQLGDDPVSSARDDGQCDNGQLLRTRRAERNKMEVERGDTGGRTRTVFVDSGMGPATLADPATLAEALASAAACGSSRLLTACSYTTR